MNKFIITLICLLHVISNINAQKVDIDNYYLTISNAELPLNYVDMDNRTYSVKVVGNNLSSKSVENFKIYGWELLPSGGQMTVEINAKNFNIGNPSANTRVVKTKDKNGKETGSTTYYTYSSSNSGDGYVKLFGVKNEYAAPKKDDKKDDKKNDKKSSKKEDKEKKEAEANPFLKNVDTKPVAVSEKNTTDDKNSIYFKDLSQSYTCSSSETTSASAAKKEYYDKSTSCINNDQNTFYNGLVPASSTFVNNLFGYKPVNLLYKFKRLDSEKHPEFPMFDNATKAMKTIFSKMRYNGPIDVIATDLEPIIGYFEGITQKYAADEKQEKRLAGAAYYNLARINFFLDNHDKVIEIGNILISKDLDEKAGKQFIALSEQIKDKLAFHQMKSRHILARPDDGTEDLGGEAKPEE